MNGDSAIRSIFAAESEDAADDPRVVAAVQEYLCVLEAGDAPSKADFIAPIRKLPIDCKTAWQVWNLCIAPL